MSRGFVASVVLHGAVFVVVWMGPSPKAFEWDIPDAIAVELAPAFDPVTPPAETPAPAIPEPTPAPPEVEAPPVEEVETGLESAPEEAPPEKAAPPEPVSRPSTKRRVPPRIIKPFAHERSDEDAETLRERLRERLEPVEEKPADTFPDAAPQPLAPSGGDPRASSAEVEVVDFPYAWYLNTLRRRITDSWDPPGQRIVAGRANRVLVRFLLHRNGRMTDLEVESESGTPGLDASARRAVQGAQPFPPLPDGYGKETLEVAVRFTVTG